MYTTYAAKCPVCQAVLGRRAKDEAFESHCDECKSSVKFFPNEEKPFMELDKVPNKPCTCGSCQK